jgi:serine/threonine protein kinase/tetratricopeptide (TPR) repeat protein
MREIGDVVNGRYLIQERVGSGASGEVFRANDGMQGIEVAVKFLAPRKTNRDVLDAFKAEFATLTQIRHPHITRVFDFAFDEVSGSHFFTSEYVQGNDFLETVKHHDPQAVIPLFMQTLRALQHLHTANIFHFDIKPKNVLVATPPNTRDLHESKVKLIDFGLASVCSANRLVGTPSYIAPEMILREYPDHRADLYSLGVLLYYSLTGTNPFRTQRRQLTFRRHLEFVPPPPSTYNPAIPAFLDAIILRLLEKRREDRYHGAAQVIEEVERHLHPDQSATLRTVDESIHPWDGPFIGRDAPLGEATRYLEHASAGTTIRPTVLAITGDAGTGKSRLLQEIKYKAQLMEFVGHTFDRVDITSRLAWLAAIDSAREDPSTPHAFFLDDVTDLLRDSPATEMMGGVRTLLQSMRTPLSLGQFDQPLRTVVVMAFESDTDAQALLTDALGLRTADFCIIPLAGFSPHEMEHFVGTITGISSPQSALIDSIMAQTSGNPLAVAQHLAAQRRAALRAPDTPTAARPHAPGADPQTQLRHALAAWGVPVGWSLLASTVGGDCPRAQLGALVACGECQFDPLHLEYRFRNASIMRDVYDAIPTAQQFALHHTIADLLTTSGHGSLSQIIYHLTLSDNADSDVRLLWELAHTQLRNARPFDALHTIDALDTLCHFPEHSAAHIDMQLFRAEALVTGKQFLAAGNIYAHIQQHFAATTEHGDRLLQILEDLGATAYAARDMEAAEAALTQALALATEQEEASDALTELRIENTLAQVWCETGEYETAIHTFERTADQAKHLPQHLQERLENNRLGLAYFHAGRIPDAVAQLSQGRQSATALHQHRRALQARYHLAVIDQQQGQFPTAMRQFKEVLALAATHRDPEFLIRTYCAMGANHSALHQLDDALSCFTAAEDHARKFGDHWLQVEIHTLIGNNLRRRNDIPSAETTFLHGLARLDLISRDAAFAAPLYCTLHYHLGSLYVRHAGPERALYHLHKARSLAARYRSCHDRRYRIAITFAELYRASGDTPHYQEELEQAQMILKEEQLEAYF